MDEYLGMIKAFAGNFTPRGYVPCNGQMMSIAQYSALYALLGTNYGGDGQTTFGVPDLRGRSMIGIGQGSGLQINHALGEKIGTENTSILITNMPNHNHPVISTVSVKVSDEKGNLGIPVAGNSIAAMVDTNTDLVNGYNAAAPTIQIAGATVATTIAAVGGSQPISILQPTLAITYIMCIEGGFPSRN
ncbi:phage tail protein [Pedobacter gandavensis]|uniref:phage tail protein n=1 Tax=Pedobacter gandavensis TaxID=2679963 RepID=UPI00292D1FB6|nr:tail fiber protein [Pedobacter gandavensis]